MASKETVESAVKAFSHSFWTSELKRISLGVIQSLYKNDPKIFNRGETNIWAASIIWSVIRTNWTRDSLLSSHIPLGEVCQFYKTRNNTISAKATTIAEQLEMQFGMHHFKTKDHLEILEELEAELKARSDLLFSDVAETISLPVRIVIGSKKKLSNEHRLQVIELIEKEAGKYADAPEDVQLLECTYDIIHNTLHCLILGPTAFLDDLEKILHPLGMFFERMKLDEAIADELFDDSNLYEPDDHYTNMITVYESMPTKDIYESMEDLDQDLKRFTGKTPEQMQKMRPLSASNKAWIDSLKAYNLPKTESLKAIEEALALDPDCLEAHICRIGWMDDPEKRIDALEDVLDIGDRVLGVQDEDFDKNRWWGDYKTRPYMRAMVYLGFELIGTGYQEEGIEIFNNLLEMNPNDNQGIRFLLMEHALLERNSQLYNKLFKQYDDESGLVFVYGRALAAYFKYGNKAKAKKIAQKAFERNPHPMFMLIGEEPYLEEVTSFQIGTPEEAMEVVDFLVRFFNKNKKIAKWMVLAFADAGYVLEDKDEDEEEGGGNGARIVPFR